MFGVDVTASINTTGYHQWEKREPIPPGEFGMFFRQTTRVERVATLWRQGQFLGLAVLTDWLFTPEFVTAPTCASLSSKAGPATTWPACHSAEEGCAPCSSTDR